MGGANFHRGGARLVCRAGNKAGMGDWYESMSRTSRSGMCLQASKSNQPRCRLSTGERRAELRLGVSRSQTDGRWRNEKM